MYYMNKRKRNLIIAAAILNLIGITVSLILSIVLLTNKSLAQEYQEYYYVLSYSSSIYYTVISFIAGIIGSIFLLYSVRQKGKYFRTSQGLYLTGFIIIIFFGGWLSWLLLFISMFIPDVIVMNTKSEIRQEQKVEDQQAQAKEQEYEEKKKKIEELKRLRDNGLITEDEYKEKLFELL